MSSLMKDALSSININELPEGNEINKEKIEREIQINFYKRYLKMVERSASEKEFHNFAVDNGYLSAKHMRLCISVESDISDVESDMGESLMSNDVIRYRELEEKLGKLKTMLSGLKLKDKRIIYYRVLMKQLGEKDISPYGEDMLCYKY